MDVLAHYLEIGWESAGVPRRVVVSTYPIEIEAAPAGTLHAEVTIFRDFAPWVGLQLSGALADAEPVTVDANGARTPWLKVSDENGGLWWIAANDWKKTKNRHESEMFRSFGTFSVELGRGKHLVLDAVASDLDRAHAQEYLDDFRDELVWLAIGQSTGALGEVGSDSRRDLVDALKDFADAAGRVLDQPAREIREITALVASSRLRPNAETFRAMMRRPGSRAYPGRVAQESANMPENRYLRGMLEHCRRISTSAARSSLRHQTHLGARAAREKDRATRLRQTETIPVDQEIFDNQLSNIRSTLDALDSWVGAPFPLQRDERSYRFTVAKELGTGKAEFKEFFSFDLDCGDYADQGENIDFSIVRFPEDLHVLVKAGKRIDDKIAITVSGMVSLTYFTTGNGKRVRRSVFSNISKIQYHSPLLEKREAAKTRYDRDGWFRTISPMERKEFRLEADIATARSKHFEAQIDNGLHISTTITAVESSLNRQSASWAKLKVEPSWTIPMSMRFVQNPKYASVLAAFQKVLALEQNTGIGANTLEKLDLINVLHSSALYERWCLIQIITALTEDFHFVPQADWIGHVVACLTHRGGHQTKRLSINFSRLRPSMTARLEMEPVLANRCRPDFRLRFFQGVAVNPAKPNSVLQAHYGHSAFGVPAPKHSGQGLVMDAKFRTRWKEGELASTLELLVETKGYGQEGDRVFILHPANRSITRRTSPLSWNKDCDYGHDHPNGHAFGSIKLAADSVSASASSNNLRRLIALELQDVFPEPEDKKEKITEREQAGKKYVENALKSQSDHSFCISCGKTHSLEDITQLSTAAGNPKWFYKCSDCGTSVMKTHCFGCGTSLYKNGFQMTYHLTIADQISSVVCYQCGAGF